VRIQGANQKQGDRVRGKLQTDRCYKINEDVEALDVTRNENK